MKKITLKSPIVFNDRTGESVRTYDFKSNTTYEVADAVASHSWLKTFIASIEDIPEPKPTRGRRKKKEAIDVNADGERVSG